MYGEVRSRSCSTLGNHLPVKEPRSRIIRDETDGHVVSSTISHGHDVAPDRIHEIRHIATRNPHNIEFVLKSRLVRYNKGEVKHIHRADV